MRASACAATGAKNRGLRALLVAVSLALGGCASFPAESTGGQDGSVGDSTPDQTSSDAPGEASVLDVGVDAFDSSSPDGNELDSGVVDSGIDGSRLDAEAGPAGCTSGQLTCDAGCVADDIHNCGACGDDCTRLQHVNASSIACTNGTCTYTCATGFANCADAGTGCGSDLSQQGNCGACNVSCSGGTPVCTTTGGQLGCGTGCPASEQLCGSSCTNTATDTANCGTCNHACTTTVANAQPSCSGSACGYTCNPTYTACAGGCWNTQSDSNHCGASCSACTGGQVCSGGACACPSASPTTCGGTCTNTQTDPNICGACGHGCLGGTCSGGMCQPVLLATTTWNPYDNAIAIDSSNVYWINNAGVVSVCPLAGGCGSGTVVYTAPSGFVAQGLAMPSSTSPYNGLLYIGAVNSSTMVSSLVQLNKGSLAATTYSFPNPGSAAGVISLTGLAFDSKNSWIYLADPGGGINFTGTLDRVKPDGTQYSQVYTVPGTMQGSTISSVVAADGTYAYLATNNGVIYCSIAGVCNSALTLANVTSVFSDGTSLWATANTVVTRAPVGSMAGTPSPVAASQKNPEFVIADANYVYWTVEAPFAVMRCPLAGCGGNPTTFVAGNGGALAQDTVALYWLAPAGVYKVAK